MYKKLMLLTPLLFVSCAKPMMLIKALEIEGFAYLIGTILLVGCLYIFFIAIKEG